MNAPAPPTPDERARAALPRILDPRVVPVAGADAHLPALAGRQLDEAVLRRRFESHRRQPAWTPEFSGDGRVLVQRAPLPAAVLMPLVRRDAGLHMLLTQRTDHLRDHAGQISFPGGRCEPGDAGPTGTALRETEEEVGLRRQHVEVIGELPAYTTVTGFVVTPVVALVTPPFELALDRFEVAEVFEVPLAFLMTPAHHQRHIFSFEGGQRQFLSMPWQGHAVGGVAREYFIWGATAAMLRNLYRFLAAAADADDDLGKGQAPGA